MKFPKYSREWQLYYLQISFFFLPHLPIVSGYSELDEDNINTSTEPLQNSKDNTQNTETAHSRQKRYVYINVQTPVNIGFLIAVPYTFALPSFNLQTSRRLKRSIEKEKELLANLTAEEIFPKDSFDDPAYAVELARMSTYFTILGVDEDICQQRLICEIFADPENHKPLSDMVDHGPVSEKPSSRFYRYSRALQEGVSGGKLACHNQYKRCPYSVEDRIYLPALHFWTFLTNTLGMEIRDD